jgi:hypothetical protein
VYFKLSRTINEISLHPDGVTSFDLVVQKDHPVRVRLLAEKVEGSGELLRCETSTEVDPNEKVLAGFTALLENRLPDGHEPIGDSPLAEHIDQEGNIEPGYVIALWPMPLAMRDFIGQIERELVAAASAVVGILRWRARSLGPPRPLSWGRTEWSTDGSEWHWMPVDTGLVLGADDRLELTTAAVADIRELIAEDRGEPLGHALFREAWSQRRGNRRSSLLLAIAALEVGVKEYITACVPDAEWLALNLPSPPVAKMLAEYLPTLTPPDGDGLAEPDTETLAVLRKANDVRNRLAHRGSDVPAETLEPTLRAVRNVLWTLDVALGHEWAKGHMFPSLEKDLAVGYRRI